MTQIFARGDITAAPQAFAHASFELGMAHLCGLGLSEPWLLRDLGDRHWRMIAARAHQPSMALRDAEGRAIYAAFAATRLQLAPQSGPFLGEEVSITSSLHCGAGHRLGSTHCLRDRHGAVLASAQMISCFLRHDETGSNRRLLRSALPGFEELPPMTAALQSLDTQAREAARHARQAPPSEVLARYSPLPALDFNAVGLLYFPTFSKIAEMVRPRSTAGLRRQVVYLSNLDHGEQVRVEALEEGLLLRAIDGRVLASITDAAPPEGPTSARQLDGKRP